MNAHNQFLKTRAFATGGALWILAVATGLTATSLRAEESPKEESEHHGKVEWSRGFYEFDERSWVDKSEMAFANRVHYDGFYHDDNIEEFQDSNDLFGFWKSISIEKDPLLVDAEEGEEKEAKLIKRSRDEKEEATSKREKAPLFERMFDSQRSQVSKEVTPEPKAKSEKAKEEAKGSSSEPLFHRLFKRDEDAVDAAEAKS